ncbi:MULTISPECIES: peptidoglycan DD-metalloendopeptidase family protein [Porphyromonadaceae]|uniref:Metalloendopeptidase n=1 Tax=Sanguibacteroides justesenii TaxID=1547597 RepID=A0A0C3RGG3_9PORP|nr:MULTISPECIES: peptidoglycan DD-metalloendopeptidase family protein [Porphyromonadaceae]KIO44574.1 metalloendopeptidase [Sanguibacteroides justesenii]KIO45172.1 metalloendopeptidase [Sanguibacteroides justesenii]PXZ44464.1 metalloendopeptidase [Sanguibacteroides justesenii]
MKKTKWIWIWAAVGVVLAIVIFWPKEYKEAVLEAEAVEEVVDTTELKQEHYKYGIPSDNFEVEEGVVGRNQSLSAILAKYGVSPKKIHEISQRCKDIFDVRKIKAGRKYTLFLAKDSLKSPEFFIYENNALEFVVIDFKETSPVYIGKKEVEVRELSAKVGIQSSLWNAMVEAQTDPTLAISLADIYAWSIDFYGIAKGDSIRVIYEESYVEEQPLRDFKIKGAIFTHAGRDFYAIPFVQNEKFSYFDEDGNSLQKTFLKAPLKYSRISSGFSNNRFHPVLKKYRSHHGIDYAAPTGTPVYTIGDGVITKKAFQKGGGGNYVTVKHNSVYSTTYMHLSRFAQGIAPGKRVKQGEVIGYVGSTGLATGPHLDFRVYKNGTPINPLKMVSPPKEPISKENMPQFIVVRDSLTRRLKQL